MAIPGVEAAFVYPLSLMPSVFAISLNTYANPTQPNPTQSNPIQSNPIPIPVPASMPLEEMAIVIHRRGNVNFSGDFTFDFIPDGNVYPPGECEVVTKMQFPLPAINATNVAVYQDGCPLAWSLATEPYPTILPEYPFLGMFEWPGPFPVGARHAGVFPDEIMLDPDSYTLVGNQLDLTLNSEFGRFTKDLIVTCRVVRPVTPFDTAVR